MLFRRPLGSDETTISIYLSKPCISEDYSQQKMFDNAEKHMNLIISNEIKEKTYLINTVLPQIFKDTYQVVI